MEWLERTVHRTVARIGTSLIQRRLTAILSALTVSAILAGAAAARPPAGLSSYGRTIWNLEALLHDTFGTRQVYGEWITANRGPLNFTTTFKGECCTSYFSSPSRTLAARPTSW